MCRWLRECPVEVMLVSLDTHFMHSVYEAAENLQKDRHDAKIHCFILKRITQIGNMSA